MRIGVIFHYLEDEGGFLSEPPPRSVLQKKKKDIPWVIFGKKKKKTGRPPSFSDERRRGEASCSSADVPEGRIIGENIRGRTLQGRRTARESGFFLQCKKNS